jgi:AraC-like DNA-binding protein
MNATLIQPVLENSASRMPAGATLTTDSRGGRGLSEPAPANFNQPAGREAGTANENHKLVEALAASETFNDYQRAFRDATGLPLTLRPIQGWQLAHQGDRRQNAFCSLMAGSNRSCSACLQMQQQICDGAADGPCTVKCAFGINESAIRVKVGGETIGYLQTGQVFFKAPTPVQTKRALKQLADWGLSLDTEEVVRAYNATPVVPQNEYQAKVRLLQFFAEQLATLANQIVIHQQTAEPVQITRARRFIEANFQEDISLGAVARQAGMSSFYFCKTFKKVTGLNYTKYVTRVRVEKAKELLLNLNYRISEIAFEVGFQSLTHFNRAFRCIACQSPTEYREQVSSN